MITTSDYETPLGRESSCGSSSADALLLRERRRRRRRRRSTNDIGYVAAANALLASGSNLASDCSSRQGGEGEGRVRERERTHSRLRRAASKGLREFWQIDGACEVLLADNGLRRDACVFGLDFFALRKHTVMSGIRDRIAGLRERAKTAPGRL